MAEIKGWDISRLPTWNVDWLWNGYIARRNLSLISSWPKAGKSTLLFSFFQSFFANEEFLGLATSAAPTVLLTEEPVPLLRQRRDELGLATAPLHILPLQPGLSWPRCIAYIKGQIVNGCGLVVIDTFSRFWGIDDENDAAKVNRALDPLFILTRTHDVAILGLHHTRKAGGPGGAGVRGSNALTGAVDISVELGRVHPYDKTARRRLESISRYSETPGTLLVHLTDSGYELLDSTVDNIDKALMAVIEENAGITAGDLADELMMGERNVQRLLTEMVGRGILERTGSGSGSSPFLYTVRAKEE